MNSQDQLKHAAMLRRESQTLWRQIDTLVSQAIEMSDQACHLEHIANEALRKNIKIKSCPTAGKPRGQRKDMTLEKLAAAEEELNNAIIAGKEKWITECILKIAAIRAGVKI